MFSPLLLLLSLITPALLQVNDREYNKICPRNDDMVTLASGNKVRYLCDDCLLDPAAKYISPTTIEECADIGSVAKDCKATMWSGGKCWCTDVSYTGSKNPTSKGCIWMTAETRSSKKDDCTTCLNEKKECVDKRRQCEDKLKHCNPDDKDCEKKARKCQDDLISCESEKEKYIKKERKCQDGFTECENEKESCVKKGRRCQDDLITCENDKDSCDKRERRCSDDQASCEKEKNKCLKEQEKCESDRQDSQREADRFRRLFNDCTDDLDKCKKSSSSWGGTDGEIKCKSGSLTTASFNGGKWLTLCGFIIKDVDPEIRGLDLQECVEACSKDDKCRAITYDNTRGDCYKAHKFTTGDMRYSRYYDTVLRLA